MNELQVLKNGYVRCARTAIALLCIPIGMLFARFEPTWFTHVLFYTAAAVIGFPVIRQAFAALAYKKVIAKVHGPQPFWRPFFGGESLGDLRLQSRDAQLLVRDLRFQAVHVCAYGEKEFERLLRKQGFRETAETLMQERLALERKCNELIGRGKDAGIEPIAVQNMLVRCGLEETKSRIAAVEQGTAEGLPMAYVLEFIEKRGLARTWAHLEDLGLHARLLDEAERLGCRDLILSAAKEYGYDGALARLKEVAKNTGQRIAV